MTPVALVILAIGGAAIYAGVTGQNVLSEVRAALSGVRPPPAPSTDGAAATAPAPAAPGAVAGGAAGGGSHGRCGGPPSGIDPTGLVVIEGHGSMKLRPEAAAAFSRAERALGRPIALTGTYRTRAQQEATINKNRASGVPTAAAGSSYHECGLAIDVHSGVAKQTDLVAALSAQGWRRWNPDGEPWHWSYQVLG